MFKQSGLPQALQRRAAIVELIFHSHLTRKKMHFLIASSPLDKSLLPFQPNKEKFKADKIISPQNLRLLPCLSTKTTADFNFLEKEEGSELQVSMDRLVKADVKEVEIAYKGGQNFQINQPYAHHAGQIDVVKVLIASGCVIDGSIDKVLHYAAALNRGHVEVISFCVSTGGKTELIMDNAGYTPLHCAVEAGHMQVALLLIAHGASAKVKNEAMVGNLGRALFHSCPSHSFDYVESIWPSGLNSPITFHDEIYQQIMKRTGL
ncbi:hypothetical protein DKX38_003197 [Salix brachista]|uniref:Uncharacterized protein n=1 Tax=Salix brachista TaxID=2182728 RepID=A0A5N5NPG6_9ROSI|nr:hypothetical protein DKX38_003197 [Salix brachista]